VSTSVAAVLFAGSAFVSLGAAWVLVTRLERVGERLGLSEGLLGLVAALAADGPEIVAAVTALLNHQGTVGAGVVIGSNVFNLVALLGLSAVAAGWIALHRKVVVLNGGVAVLIAALCYGTVTGGLAPAVALAISTVVMGAYATLLGVTRRALRHLPLPRRWLGWLAVAVTQEDIELSEAIRPAPGGAGDAGVATAAAAVVIGASAVMERSASIVGEHYAVPEIVLGALILAAVTSLPNAVSAVYLSSRGRGAAVLSIALNSNAINVLVGFLVPAVIIGLSHTSDMQVIVAGWYLAVTVFCLVLAYGYRGLSRGSGIAIIVCYMAFVTWLITAA
jgi:cation:H+ antiporter